VFYSSSLAPADELSKKDWLDILSRFPQLEVYRGAGLWAAVNMDKDQMHNAILELVQLCPKLRQLDHCEFHDKRHNWKRIVIIREGLDGENVRYEIQKPPPRYVFYLYLYRVCNLFVIRQ
jgi:hypothetical protein